MTADSFCLKDDSMHAVTFLALGNGAPDISSSIAAISSGNYELALGALLGTSPTATTFYATRKNRDSSIAGGHAAVGKLYKVALASSVMQVLDNATLPVIPDMHLSHQSMRRTVPHLQAAACLWGRSWRGPSCWSTGAPRRGALC